MIHIIRTLATKQEMDEMMQNNRSMEILDPEIRQRVATIAHKLLGGI